MEPTPDTDLTAPTRRAVLGGTAGATGALSSGCVRRARSLFNRQSGHQVPLTVKTVPADEDRAATEIARLLDEQAIAEEVIEGYLRPAAVPVPGLRCTPDDLRWVGDDPKVHFLGTDGNIDAAGARALGRVACYQYNDEDQFISR